MGTCCSKKNQNLSKIYMTLDIDDCPVCLENPPTDKRICRTKDCGCRICKTCLKDMRNRGIGCPYCYSKLKWGFSLGGCGRTLYWQIPLLRGSYRLYRPYTKN